MWRSIVAATVILATVMVIPVDAQQASHGTRFVTVADMIQATVVGDPEGLQGEHVTHLAEFSPDGRRVAVVVRHGNLDENTVESSILVFTLPDIFRSPAPDTVVTFASSSNRPAIRHVRWLADSCTLAFLGERPHELPQVYTVDIQTRALARLTEHSTAIATYDITPSGQVVAYTAEPTPDTAYAMQVQRHGLVMTGQAASDGMLNLHEFDPFSQETRLFVKDLDTGRLTAVSDSGVGRCQDSFGLSLAPSGRFASYYRS